MASVAYPHMYIPGGGLCGAAAASSLGSLAPTWRCYAVRRLICTPPWKILGPPRALEMSPVEPNGRTNSKMKLSGPQIVLKSF